MIFILCFICVVFGDNNNKNFTPPELNVGGWTPLPAKISNLKIINTSEAVKTSSTSQQKQVTSAPNDHIQRVDVDMLPIPVIKPHAHGATLGFDLPEQGLTLYLDIDELATKPLAQNIGVKVVTHDRTQSGSSTSHQSQKAPASAPAPAPSNQQNTKTPLSPVQASKVSKGSKQTVPKRPKPKFIGSYEGNVPASNGKQSNKQKYQVGYIRQSDLHKALKQVGLNQAKINKLNGNPYYGPQDNYSPQIKMNDYGPKAPKKPTPAPGPAPAPGINTKAPTKVPKTKKPTTTKAVQQPEQDAQDFENDVAIISTTQSTVIQSELEDDVQQQTYEEDDQHIEPQKQISKDDWADDINNGEIELNKENLLSQPQPLLTPTTNAHSIPPQDNTIIKPFSQGQSESCSQVPMCQHFCNPTTQKIINDATTIKEIANQLNANEFIQTFPSASEQIQTIIDTQNSYTIFMPSNNAISQLPHNLVHHLQNDQDALRNMIDNHILDTTQSLEDMHLAEIIQPRALGASLRVNSPRNQTYTVNGQRIMIADQQGPGGGMIHVIDGLLYPTSDRDILGTLKTCNRFDGFITLAEGTGFAETLKQSK